MHPIERLRYVARATGDGPSLLVREAAGALASFSAEPAALVTACRRLVDRQPHAATMWWLAARVLGASEPAREAWTATDELEEDPTSAVLAHLLPDEATVMVIGWPELAAAALPPRGDLEVFVIDAGGGDGATLARRLDRAGTEAVLVDERSTGAAAAAADLVLVEAFGVGATGVVAAAGSRAAAAVARHAGQKVWAVAGVGRVLPGRLWDAYLRRLEDEGDPWELDHELVPLDLFDGVVGPSGLQTPQDALKRADCPIAPELLRAIA